MSSAIPKTKDKKKFKPLTLKLNPGTKKTQNDIVSEQKSCGLELLNITLSYKKND